MATDVRHGVVDRDGNVFGARNLYVAGGSVFCTAGVANPTLTIVALALRLANHIAGILGAARPRRSWYEVAAGSGQRSGAHGAGDPDDETEAFLRRMSVELTTRVRQIIDEPGASA
jgi:hypothetical protein